MTIVFQLRWHRKGLPLRRAFKNSSMGAVFGDFIGRIGRFSECRVEGGTFPSVIAGEVSAVMVCHRGPESRMFSSEDLAGRVGRWLDRSVKILHVVVGGPDGFTERELAAMRPDVLWSFGPMTLPHELAAVVASEQIYRAWTILKHLPYHCSH
jgi:23S rRNA (pseudouridine1915-N3)-methyltransferase